MIRVLLIGDTHIPDRAEAIPRPLLEYIENLKPWDIVGFTGDLTSEEILEWTRSLGRQVYVVRGNMDYLPLPKHSIFNIGDIVFGITHGDGVYPRGDIVKLSRQAQELGVQVFMTGHTQHKTLLNKEQVENTIIKPRLSNRCMGWGRWFLHSISHRTRS